MIVNEGNPVDNLYLCFQKAFDKHLILSHFTREYDTLNGKLAPVQYSYFQNYILFITCYTVYLNNYNSKCNTRHLVCLNPLVYKVHFTPLQHKLYPSHSSQYNQPQVFVCGFQPLNAQMVEGPQTVGIGLDPLWQLHKLQYISLGSVLWAWE